MFLSMTMERNPEVVSAALDLHRSGSIGPNTFVLDIDRIIENAGVIAEAARDNGLLLYVMTKQVGRNPFMARAAAEGGIPTAVAVDTSEAQQLHRYGVPVGHVGHLVQIPSRDIAAVLSMRPEVVTVFTVEEAEAVARVARAVGVEQDLLLRILEPNDFRYPGQEGGFPIAALDGVRVVGLTAFPCLLFDYASRQVQPASNLTSLIRAANLLRRDLSVDVRQVNAPSITCAATMGLLRASGATHGEPGSALTGNTPLHAVSAQPERPAMVYVSEVAGVDGDLAYCFGGGFYARSRAARALLATPAGDRLMAEFLPLPPDAIDYYASLHLQAGVRAHVGDSVLFAFRSQVFVSRSRVVAVGGIARDNAAVLGVCDAMGNVLDKDGYPLGAREARVFVDRIWDRYIAGWRRSQDKRQQEENQYPSGGEALA